jgi:oxygen-independent coproporphyrinogen-3 oxidase
MAVPPHSIYLHIPFCRHICTYCAFNTYAGIDDQIPAYADALMREITQVALLAPEDIEIGTVFFGGGTPSMLPAEMAADILACIRRSFKVKADAEISLEANPNDLTEPYLRGLYAAGVNRLSIGMQSAVAAELAMYERQHTPDMVTASIHWARRTGIQNISLDLIFGNPQQTEAMWQHTLDEALSLNPNHISLYGLEVKGGTVLRQQLLEGRLQLPAEESTSRMYEAACDVLAAHGYTHYEISNWAKPGQEARHNLQYWHNAPYFGFGAGAHGYVAGVRTVNVRLPARYISRMVDAGAKRFMYPRSAANSKTTAIQRDEEIAETIMLGMRMTVEGISFARFSERFGADLRELRRQPLKRLSALGMIEVLNDRVRLTQRGCLLSNPVIAELI